MERSGVNDGTLYGERWNDLWRSAAPMVAIRRTAMANRPRFPPEAVTGGDNARTIVHRAVPTARYVPFFCSLLPAPGSARRMGVTATVPDAGARGRHRDTGSARPRSIAQSRPAPAAGRGSVPRRAGDQAGSRNSRSNSALSRGWALMASLADVSLRSASGRPPSASRRRSTW